MSSTTTNLKLFKYDTTTDTALPFSINTALNENWDKIDILGNTINNKVNKSGDTMTGTLKIGTNLAYPGVMTQTNTYTYNTAPSESTGIGTYSVLDKNGQWVAMFKAERYADNHTVVVMQGHSQTGKDGRIQLASDSNGNWCATCPSSALAGSIVTTSSISKASNGYVTFGNGIILQWGRLAVTTDGTYTVTYPKAFSGAQTYTIVKNYGSGQNSNLMDFEGSFYSLTASTAKTHCTLADTGGFSWLAIGY